MSSSKKTKERIKTHKKKPRSLETKSIKAHKENSVKRYSEEWKKKVSKGWFKKGHIPWMKGKKMSPETKKKLYEVNKGRKAWNKGKKMLEEEKKRLSELFKGIHRSPKTEFKKGQFKGSKNPAKRIEVRRKISEAKKGKLHPNQRGKNHGNWKGGVATKNEKIRKTLKYKLWRETIFTRDDWACQKCRIRRGKIVSHHLYNFADFPELQTSIENGVTLCRKCHVEFHKIYGLKNNTKEKFKKFLNSSINN